MKHPLNPEQEKAVRTVQGRVLVLAGAGSGKTRVIVHRIAHLIRDLHVSPQAILGLTFTNKAAAEMRSRVEAMIGQALAKEVTLCTFHSFCMQLLRKEIGRLGYTRDFSLYDEGDLKRVIDGLTRELLNHDGVLPSLNPTYAALARRDQGAEDGEENWHGQFSKELHQKLGSALRAYNAVSFDTMISLTTQLFDEHPEVLKRVQDRFRYVMIDEYQDTNPAQMRLAEHLVRESSNLCVVGDDDQSIYGWRGAEVKNILQFKADVVIKLEQNYRSTPQILAAANAAIQKNLNRYEKKLWSAKQAGELIEVFHAPTEMDEAQAIVTRLLRLQKEQSLSFHDFAILFRSNALSRQIELALASAPWQNEEGKWLRGIPYEIFGGLPFAERSEIKDLFSYLRLIANPLDTASLLRIVNVPRRGISSALLDEITQKSRASGLPLWSVFEKIADGELDLVSAQRTRALAQFVALMRKLRCRFEEGPLHSALAYMIEEIQYKRAIEEEVKSEKMRQFKWENVQECVNALAHYQQENPLEEKSLQHFLSTTLLAREPSIKAKRQGREDQVQLMTLHSVKGLEFPVCFLIGLEDHLLPHAKSTELGGVEEERRLFYVGITRAQKLLVLSMSRSRARMGKQVPSNPSRFLFEIPKELLNITKA